jgi:hypothetical protein
VREIARTGLMGRDKLYELAALARERGWLEAGAELPDDAAIAQALKPRKRAASTVSAAEPLREVVQRWFNAGVQGRAIHAALQREHGFKGSYSAIVRLLRGMQAARPVETTVRLSFAPAEAAQVDFGAGPVLPHPDGKPRRTWAFVMTLAHSRHQYVEFVWDQTVATWLGCHRRAFEWFDGVPERVIVDNAKCAIIKACSRTHLRSRRPGQRMTVSDHLPPQARAFFAHDKRWCLMRAAEVGPHCFDLIGRLLGDRIAERLRSAQGVLAMAAQYGSQRLEAACERALLHDSPHYRTVKTILATGADLQPMAAPETPPAYASARFTRSAAELFSSDLFSDQLGNEPPLH